MTKANKQLAQFLQRPESVRYAVIEKLLLNAGFSKAQAEGSHIKFRHSAMPQNLILAVHKGDCKNYLKKQAAEALSLYGNLN